MANIPKIQKACIPISLKVIRLFRIPFNINKNIPYPSKFLANIPVSLKTLPGPQYSCFVGNDVMCIISPLPPA